MMDTTQSPFIFAAQADNFTTLVLDNSHKGPVLVNFWSKNAGPCLRQYPLLDKVIHHYDGRVLLINVDADKEIIITKQYGIASVPTLKLFRNGDVIETRHGYQSEEELIKLLEPYVARDSDLTLADAVQLFVEGKTVAAYEMIAGAIAEDPVNHRLPLTMAKLLKHEGRIDDAMRLLESLPPPICDHTEIKQFRDLLSFYIEAGTENIEPASQIRLLESEPDNLALRRQLVNQYVIQQEYESALQQLVAIMERQADYENKYPQQAMLKIFNILGKEHPLVSAYRSSLSRYVH